MYQDLLTCFFTMCCFLKVDQSLDMNRSSKREPIKQIDQNLDLHHVYPNKIQWTGIFIYI